MDRDENDRERLVSLLLLALFLLIAGGTGVFVYQQTHASDAQVQSPTAESLPPAPMPPPARESGPKPLIPPKLLNLDDLRRNVRKFYPPEEKAAGKEGRVLFALVVEADGSVSRADVKVSGGPDFDEAARKVALALRFAPARRGDDPVAVQIDEGVDFTLGR